MDLKDVRVLNALSTAKYNARQQLFQILLQREQAIRTELIRLDEQSARSEGHSDSGMKTIGADVIWKAWVGKARTSLNMKLAVILAEKEQHIRQVRQAYGRVIATEDLLTTLTAEAKDNARRIALEKAIEMSLQSRRSGSF